MKKATEKQPTSIGIAFPISSVFFGALVGPSMVTGIFSTVYFAPYGAWSVFLTLGYTAVTALVVAFGAEFARRNQVYEYNGYCKKLYGRFSKICVPIVEIYMILSMVLTVGSVTAMGSTFFEELTGMPNILGAIIMALICMVLVLWGAKIVRTASSIMTIILVVGFIALFACCVGVRVDRIGEIFSTWYVPEGANLGVGVFNAITFGFSGCCNALVLCAVEQKVSKKRHSVAVGLCCLVLNTLVFVIDVLMVLPYCPEAITNAVPTLGIINNYLVNYFHWMPAVYYIIMFFALVTSGVPATLSVTARVGKIMPKHSPWTNEKFRNAVIGAVFMVIVILVSRLGLSTIVSKGYTFLGYIGIPLLFIPIVIIMPIRWHLEKKKQNAVEQKATNAE